MALPQPVTEGPHDKPKRGRGRPATPDHLRRIDVPLRLPAWLAEWLEKQPGSKTGTIEAALIKAHSLQPPKP